MLIQQKEEPPTHVPWLRTKVGGPQSPFVPRELSLATHPSALKMSVQLTLEPHPRSEDGWQWPFLWSIWR